MDTTNTKKLKETYAKHGIRIFRRPADGTWMATAIDDFFCQTFYPYLQFENVEAVGENLNMFWHVFPMKLKSNIQLWQSEYPAKSKYQMYMEEWDSLFGFSEKIICAAVDEILPSVSTTFLDNSQCGSGNYWIDEQYNLSCDMVTQNHTLKYTITLEHDALMDWKGPSFTTGTMGIFDLESAVRRVIYDSLRAGIRFSKPV